MTAPERPNRLAFATRTIHGGQSHDPLTGAGHGADLCNLDLCAGEPRRSQGLRICPVAETRPGSPSSGRSPISKAAAPALPSHRASPRSRQCWNCSTAGRSHRRHRRHLWRHLPPAGTGPEAVGRARGELRRFHRSRRRRGGDPARDEDAVGRDADQSDAAHRRSRGGGNARQATRPRHRRRQHLRQPLYPAAARTRHRHRGAFDDQISERPFRHGRRFGGGRGTQRPSPRS